MSVSVDTEGRRVRLDLNETEATELLHLLRTPADFPELGWLYLNEIARRLGETLAIRAARAAGRRDALTLAAILAELVAALHAEGLAGAGTARPHGGEQAAARLVSRCPSLVALALPGPPS